MYHDETGQSLETLLRPQIPWRVSRLCADVLIGSGDASFGWPQAHAGRPVADASTSAHMVGSGRALVVGRQRREVRRRVGQLGMRDLMVRKWRWRLEGMRRRRRKGTDGERGEAWALCMYGNVE